MRESSSAGASLVEFALVIVLILAFMAAIAEIARFRAIQGILAQAAQRGVIVGSRIRDIHWEEQDGTEKFDRFIAARATAIAEAVRLPTGSFLQASSASVSNKLISYLGVEMPGGGFQDVDAILLRPGEFTFSGDGRTIFYPGMCPATGLCDGSPRRPPNTRMEQLLSEQQNPLFVQVRAQVRPLLPIPGNYVMEGRALGFQEAQREGVYTKPIPTGTRTPVPSPPTATPGDTPTRDPSAPTATPTPLPSPSATPTATYFPCFCPPINGTPSAHTLCRLINGGCAICPDFSNQCICSAAGDPACVTGGGGG